MNRDLFALEDLLIDDTGAIIINSNYTATAMAKRINNLNQLLKDQNGALIVTVSTVPFTELRHPTKWEDLQVDDNGALVVKDISHYVPPS